KRKEAIEFGRRLLNQSLAEFSLNLKKVADEQMKPMLTEFGMKSPDELYEKIGLGERLAPLIARRLLPIDDPATQNATPAPLAIAGTEGLVISYARCCFPIPNDPVMAYLSSG